MKTFRVKVTDEQGNPAALTIRLEAKLGKEPTDGDARQKAEAMVRRSVRIVAIEQVPPEAEGCI